MIIDLPSTTSAAINKSMVDLRERGGTIALGRVLTLVIVTEEAGSEAPIAAANAASFEHPCRVIVVAQGTKRGAARMDAQIRVGGDAGASEVIVLRLFGPMAEQGASVVVPLLLADAPVVAWWPGAAPDDSAQDPIGALARRRITDAAAANRPLAALGIRRANHHSGDTDLAWTRITNWRGLLAAALDQPPHDKVRSAVVAGAPDSASTELLAGWLAWQLKCPVQRVVKGRAGAGMHSVTLERRSGTIRLDRPDRQTASLTMEYQPERSLALPRRSLRDCLSEELRRLDDDEVYAEVLTKGLDLVSAKGSTASASAKVPKQKPAGTGKPATTGKAATTGKPAAQKPAATRKPAVEKPAATRKPAAQKTAASRAPAGRGSGKAKKK
ncbi:MAG: glucose-6-phosphate dehydrogenase assembly protein OpcA [Nakamurella sp.]